MKKAYVPKEFRAESYNFIQKLDEIIREYQKMGFMLTVRQLYYQLVARGLIPNTLSEYKRVASLINDAKLAGLLDWEAIEDRTREFIRKQRWQSGAHILKAAVSGYHEDMWDNQQMRVFVIVEKEALVGVLENVCRQYDVPLLAARGYPSGTVLREFAVADLQDAVQCGQTPVVLHFGDHDPSGLDMTRDLQERLSMFTEDFVIVERLALNMEQIEELRPPENPAKTTDSRFRQYRSRFGDSSWELDALNPNYLVNLAESSISNYIDQDQWDISHNRVEAVRTKISDFAKTF